MKSEKKHIDEILQRNKKIQGVINDSVKDLGKRFTTVKGVQFSNVMKESMTDLHASITNEIKDGARRQWLLANEKTNKDIDGYLRTVKISDVFQKSFRSPNLPALESFLDRTDNGMNISSRVWKVTSGIQKQIEGVISTGVFEGKSAVRLSKELEGFINGKPIPYNGTLLPGKNLTFQAIRLASTEMNMAYRASDYTQNSRLPFVTGIEVHLSGSHPRPDICDDLQGDYPKDFQFVGWHPLCICYTTWKTLPVKEFVRQLATGQTTSNRLVTDIPGKVIQYIEKHKERLQKSNPYWLRDNFDKDLNLVSTGKFAFDKSPQTSQAFITSSKIVQKNNELKNLKKGTKKYVKARQEVIKLKEEYGAEKVATIENFSTVETSNEIGISLSNKLHGKLIQTNDSIFISSVEVTQTERNRGLGTKFLETVEELARTKGLSKITLTAEDDGLWYWGKKGFIITENRDLYLRDLSKIAKKVGVSFTDERDIYKLWKYRNDYPQLFPGQLVMEKRLSLPTRVKSIKKHRFSYGSG